MTKIVPTDKARQGHWGWYLLIILIVGLVLAFVAWGLVEIYGRAIEPSDGAISAISVDVADNLRPGSRAI